MRLSFTIITIFLFLGLMGLTSLSQGQTEINIHKKSISFSEFMRRVGKYNLEYRTKLLDLDIALAEEESAKIFEDPTFSFEATDNGQRRMKMGYEFETGLEWTLELGGKRKARINVAKNQTELIRTLLSEYFHELRADVTIQFLETIKEKNLLVAKINSYESMKKLAHSDSIRFVLGELTEIDARQSKLEAISLLNEVIQQKADLEKSLLETNRLMGYYDADSIFSPEAKINNLDRNYQITELLTQAQEKRSDLKAALQNRNLSQSLLKLVRAERSLDLDLSIDIGNTTEVLNIAASAPSMTSITAGIAIPLKFSNRNKGKLRAAQHVLAQSELHYKNIEMDIRSEVYQAFFQFQASRKQIQQFNADLLNSAQRILDGKTYSYQRGETSLLEVLEAQRSFTELQENYQKALFTYGSALVGLQRVTGVWDIFL